MKANFGSLVLVGTVAVLVGVANEAALRGQGSETGLGAEALAAVGVEVRLGTTSLPDELNELRQSVAVLPGGGFAVVWREGKFPSGAVRLQYVLPLGNVAFPGGGLTLATGAQDHQTPVVVPHPTSGVLVAFGRGDAYGPSELLVQWVDGDGRPRWPGEGVSAFSAPVENERYTEQHLVANADGGAFVCAMRHDFTFDERIVCQRIGPAGRLRWAPKGVEAGGHPGWRVLPKAVSDGKGGIFVFWRNNRLLNDDRIDPVLVEGQRLAGDGRPLWGEAGRVIRTCNVAEIDNHGFNELDVVADGAGGAVIAFNDWNGNGHPNLDVLAQRVGGDGHLAWSKGVTVAAGRRTEALDSLIASPDGGVIVTVWHVQGSTRSSLRSYRLLPGGSHAWGAAGVSLSDPRATALDFGSYGEVDGDRVRLAWTHQLSPATREFDIYVAEYTLGGRRLVPAVGLPLHTRPKGQFLRGFVYDHQRGVGLALFEEFRPGEPDPSDTLAALYPGLP